MINIPNSYIPHASSSIFGTSVYYNTKEFFLMFKSSLGWCEVFMKGFHAVCIIYFAIVLTII